MSVDLFYPWNRPRASRVEQLITQITSLQSEVIWGVNSGEAQKTHTREKIDEYLKNNKLSSIDDLKKKMEDTLGEEQKKAYRDMMKSFEEFNGELSTEFEIISAIGAIAGTVAASAKFLEFVQAGGIALGAKLAARGLAKILGKEAELGVKMMTVALRGLKSFTQGFELSETALKAIKMVKIAGEVIGAIAIVLDGILAIVAAVEGDKQRTKLNDAINDLVYRRFSTMELRKLGKVYEAYVGGMYQTIVQYTAADTLPDLPESVRKQIMDASIQSIIKNLKTESAKITFDTTYNDLATMDETAKAFTEEDPKKEALREWYKTEKDPKKFKKDD
ncbi:hypothetical protein AFLA70_123g001852 [Aspergillus flavus AF70]|nr:hypothetical protein AFLA70_123g001852 [Aspergillus flavus AF70]